jgi:glyoxylase-like metal-dependent hydrolase (beta-lactamase superfamily II)
MSPARRGGGDGAAARFARAPVAGLPAVHQITLPTPWSTGSVQVYLIESDPLTLVDCGLDDDDSRLALGGALEALGYGFEDVRRVVLTHHHRDHLGLAQALRESAGEGFEVWAHVDAAPMIEGFSPERDEEEVQGTAELFLEFGVPGDVVARIAETRRRKLAEEPARCRPTRVDRLLRDGDVVPFKDLALDVIHSPGHTAGHVLLHHAPSRVLISGDQILGGAVPAVDNYFTGGLPDPADPLRRRPRYMGLLEYRRSLRRLRERSFSAILPGFGGVIRLPERAIREALLFYEVRIQRIERSLRSVSAIGQAVTAYEVWRALFPGADPVTEMRTRLLTVIGALDVLEDEGQCETSRRTDGVLVHRHAP